MEKLKELISFLAKNLGGQTTKTFFTVALTLLLYKFLGVLGMLIAFILCVGIDVCGTFNLKKVFVFLKDKFFASNTVAPLIIFAFFLVGCGSSIDMAQGYYSVSAMKLISKDTITVSEFNRLVAAKQLPPLSKCGKNVLKNSEEKQMNTFYFHYDEKTNRLFNIKELISNRDTIYIVEKKEFQK